MRGWIFPGKASSLNTKDFSSAADAQHFFGTGLPASHFGLAATAQVNQAIVQRLLPQTGQVAFGPINARRLSLGCSSSNRPVRP